MILFWHIFLYCIVVFFTVYDGFDGSNNLPCLTVAKHGDTINISCSVTMLDSKVIILDPMYKEVAFCTLPSNTSICKTNVQAGQIFQDLAKKTTVFRLATLHFKSLDGMWTCIHGYDRAEIFIKLSKGFIFHATLKMSADSLEIGHDHQKKFSVIAKCETCYTPVGNTAVFYINSISKDEVKRLRDKCYHIGEECRADTCGCSVLRHEYTCKLHIETLIKGTTISCSMRFEDKNNHVIKEALLQYDGKGFTNHTVRTKIVRQGTDELIVTTNVKDTPDITKLDVSTVIVIVVSIVIVIIVIIVVFICCKNHNQCCSEFKKVPSDEEENISLENNQCCSEFKNVPCDEEENISLKNSNDIEVKVCVGQMHNENVTSSNKTDDINDDSNHIEKEFNVGQIHNENVTSRNKTDNINDSNDIEVTVCVGQIHNENVTSSNNTDDTNDSNQIEEEITVGQIHNENGTSSNKTDDTNDSNHIEEELNVRQIQNENVTLINVTDDTNDSNQIEEEFTVGQVHNENVTSSNKTDDINDSNNIEEELNVSQTHNENVTSSNKTDDTNAPGDECARCYNCGIEADLVGTCAEAPERQQILMISSSSDTSLVEKIDSEHWESSLLRSYPSSESCISQQSLEFTSPSLAVESGFGSSSSFSSNQSSSSSNLSNMTEPQLPSLKDEHKHSIHRVSGPASRDRQVPQNNRKNTPKEKYPEYVPIERRRASYRNWPPNLDFLHPHDLSECGFYYSNNGDCVRCFHCGIGLRNWESDDNPWVEHARWSRNCPYLLQRRGQEFIDSVLAVLGIETDAEIEQRAASETPVSTMQEEDPGKTQKEKEDWKDLYTCVICFDEIVGITFVPCGHLVTCKTCGLAIRRCPSCSTFIRGTIKTTI